MISVGALIRLRRLNGRRREPTSGVRGDPMTTGVAADDRAEPIGRRRICKGGPEERRREPGRPCGFDAASLRRRANLRLRTGKLSGPVKPAERRIDRDERSRALRIGDGEVDRGSAAQRKADERHAVEAEVIDERAEIVGVRIAVVAWPSIGRIRADRSERPGTGPTRPEPDRPTYVNRD